jgi:hypothetical protein
VQRRLKRLRSDGVFARKCFESNKYVTRFDSHVALERVKVGLSQPIEDLK